MHHDAPPTAAILRESAAADYLGLSRWFLRRARADGRGPAYLKLGRTIRYRARDLDDWLARHLVRPCEPSKLTP
jgi:excisionase family DNA binding protein